MEPTSWKKIIIRVLIKISSWIQTDPNRRYVAYVANLTHRKANLLEPNKVSQENLTPTQSHDFNLDWWTTLTLILKKKSKLHQRSLKLVASSYPSLLLLKYT